MDQLRPMEAVGRTAGAAAHDFNNVLTIIMGYTSMLLRTLPRDDPSRMAIAEIQQAAERGSKLALDLAESYKAALPPEELKD
jgi:two-component system, cell cycle sensor histidine kinase and response regulator CckA